MNEKNNFTRIENYFLLRKIKENQDATLFIGLHRYYKQFSYCLRKLSSSVNKDFLIYLKSKKAFLKNLENDNHYIKYIESFNSIDYAYYFIEFFDFDSIINFIVNFEKVNHFNIPHNLIHNLLREITLALTNSYLKNKEYEVVNLVNIYLTKNEYKRTIKINENPSEITNESLIFLENKLTNNKESDSKMKIRILNIFERDFSIMFNVHEYNCLNLTLTYRHQVDIFKRLKLNICLIMIYLINNDHLIGKKVINLLDVNNNIKLNISRELPIEMISFIQMLLSDKLGNSIDDIINHPYIFKDFEQLTFPFDSNLDFQFEMKNSFDILGLINKQIESIKKSIQENIIPDLFEEKKNNIVIENKESEANKYFSFKGNQSNKTTNLNDDNQKIINLEENKQNEIPKLNDNRSKFESLINDIKPPEDILIKPKENINLNISNKQINPFEERHNQNQNIDSFIKSIKPCDQRNDDISKTIIPSSLNSKSDVKLENNDSEEKNEIILKKKIKNNDIIIKKEFIQENYFYKLYNEYNQIKIKYKEIEVSNSNLPNDVKNILANLNSNFFLKNEK